MKRARPGLPPRPSWRAGGWRRPRTAGSSGSWDREDRARGQQTNTRDDGASPPPLPDDAALSLSLSPRPRALLPSSPTYLTRRPSTWRKRALPRDADRPAGRSQAVGPGGEAMRLSFRERVRRQNWRGRPRPEWHHLSLSFFSITSHGPARRGGAEHTEIQTAHKSAKASPPPPPPPPPTPRHLSPSLMHPHYPPAPAPAPPLHPRPRRPCPCPPPPPARRGPARPPPPAQGPPPPPHHSHQQPPRPPPPAQASGQPPPPPPPPPPQRRQPQRRPSALAAAPPPPALPRPRPTPVQDASTTSFTRRLYSRRFSPYRRAASELAGELGLGSHSSDWTRKERKERGGAFPE